MANQEQTRFPRGQVSMGGDLFQVTDAELAINNNVKTKHTLRKQGKPAGFVVGNREAQVTLNCIVDEDGRERDWVKLCKTAAGKNVQFKSPVDTDVFEGVVQQATLTYPADDAIGIRIVMIGDVPD